MAEAGGVAPGAALVEAQGGEGERGGSPGGVLALEERPGGQGSSYALTCAARPALHRGVGAPPAAGRCCGLGAATTSRLGRRENYDDNGELRMMTEDVFFGFIPGGGGMENE